MAAPNRRLQRERQLRGWSQAYLAEQIEAPADYYISRWERGAFLPSPLYQQKLCELFGKTAEALGFLQDEPPPQTRSFDEELRFPSTAARAPIGTIGNPFTYGNPISDPQRFFGRRHEVQQVFSRLRNAEFESSSIVGERRIGKTSLLKYLAHPIVRQHYGLDVNKYLFVYVDLQIVDRNTTPMRLWQRLLRQISSCCSDDQIKQMLGEVYQRQEIDNFALEDVFDSVDAKGQYVVLLLDEFEHVTENANFNADFFDLLRALVIGHHLALILSSRRKLYEMCHSQAISSSPFFNIFAHINLRLFTENEARDLITRSLIGTGTKFTDTEIETIFRLAGYHPYFLQVACSFLFNAYSKNLNPQERVISLHKAFREETEPHLAFYWHKSDDQEKITLTALTLLEGARRINGRNVSMHQLQDLYARLSRTLTDLKERGLVTSTGDTFSLFNTSFGEWIWNELTDTRRNQQRYDEWLTSDEWATGHLKDLPDTTKKELGEILSKMNGEYWRPLFQWLIEPGMFSIGGGLIKELLASGWVF
ncbi:MAG TPA: AAA-like domain-containing protein [Ktedonobacteraceae bacterium]|nr:AAA-like domain-containing protein [Ktedonobacteraceae bacterium]